ncbi:MAG: hypothetical protein KKB50_07170 [Planctomycetes bacterium]|nr:hypothetical protein [Planctomycetota bacterium]
MKRVLLLAWRYVAYHKGKTIILVACLTLTMVLPLTAHLLITHYGEALLARAQATPLIVGARGNRFDLVLKSLYFGSAHVDAIHMSEIEAVRDSGLGLPIPLHLEFTARKHPIVGTTPEYYEFRGLQVAAGSLPLRLGQALLGAHVAADLRLRPGDHLFSDQRSLYDIAKTYPLKMHVAGVLRETNTPDDDAVFVDIKTAWLIAGIVHGHQDVVHTTDDAVILRRDADNVMTNAAIVEYNEVTPENLATFHLHGTPADLPLSAIVVLPQDQKSATLLKARYGLSKTHRMLVPVQVVDELLGLVFRVKRFFDANFALITVSTALFLALVVLLSHRLRRREMQTMHKIGCSRMIVFWLQAAELGIVLVLSLGLAGGLAVAITAAVPRIVRLM